MAPFHSAVPISHDSVCQHAQYQNHETESVFHFIIYIVAYIVNELKIIFCGNVNCLNQTDAQAIRKKSGNVVQNVCKKKRTCNQNLISFPITDLVVITCMYWKGERIVHCNKSNTSQYSVLYYLNKFTLLLSREMRRLSHLKNAKKKHYKSKSSDKSSK